MKTSILKFSFFWTCFCFLTFFSTSCEKDTDPSSEKQMLTFVLNDFSPAVVGVINEANKTVTVTIPADGDVSTLKPTIKVSSKASVSPMSGVVQNFSNPVTYTVTAEDGSTIEYLVTVGGDATSAKTLTGNINVNTTLKNRNNFIDYVIDGTYVIDGNALLTVEPGVKIVFSGSDGRIIVGNDAGLKMLGTANDPIILTGPINNPNKGSWYQIWIKSNRADNQFEFVQFLNGGSNENWSVIELDNLAKLKMNNCLIDGSLGYGVSCANNTAQLTEFNNNLIKNCVKSPMYFTDLTQVSSLNMTSVFVQNGYSYIYIAGSSIIEKTITIPIISVPFYFEDYIIIEGGTFTLQAGAKFLFKGGSYLEVRDNGILKIIGTSAAPVLLSRLDNTSANWGGVFILNKNANSISNCTIEYGGNIWDNTNLFVSQTGKIDLSNVIIKNSDGYGVGHYEGSQITHSAVSFSMCASGNVYNFETEQLRSAL